MIDEGTLIFVEFVEREQRELLVGELELGSRVLVADVDVEGD